MSLKLWLWIGAGAVALSGWVYGGLQKAARASDRAQVIATQLEASKTALRAAERSAENARRLSEERLQISDKLRKEGLKREQALRKALEADPGWAGAPVPDSVWDALGYPADGAEPARPSSTR